MTFTVFCFSLAELRGEKKRSTEGDVQLLQDCQCHNAVVCNKERFSPSSELPYMWGRHRISFSIDQLFTEQGYSAPRPLITMLLSRLRLFVCFLCVILCAHTRRTKIIHCGFVKLLLQGSFKPEPLLLCTKYIWKRLLIFELLPCTLQHFCVV